MKRVYIVNGGLQYTQLFVKLGYTIANDLEDLSLVVFTGGEDVSPELYGARKHHSTHNNPHRDQYESDVFRECLDRDIPMVGICRGAQFLNVMSGGEMYQDVTYHLGDHLITDLETGESVHVSSTHHQMMKPSPNGRLVASAGLRGGRVWWDGNVFNRDVSKEDIEVVYYQETNCLCFQPHPEFSSSQYDGMYLYFKSLLERFLVKKECPVDACC